MVILDKTYLQFFADLVALAEVLPLALEVVFAVVLEFAD